MSALVAVALVSLAAGAAVGVGLFWLLLVSISRLPDGTQDSMAGPPHPELANLSAMSPLGREP